MTRTEAIALLEKYNRGAASPAEAAALKYWYIHEASSEGMELNDESYDSIHESMWQVVATAVAPKDRLRLWPRIRLAAGIAAALATIIFGVWFFNTRYSAPSPSSRTAGRELLNDVAPGRSGATITLASGEVIHLDSTQTGVIVDPTSLTYTDGTVVSDVPSNNDSNALTITASTAKGQTYQFTLPDGTQVYLNAASKLSFSTNLSETAKRIVTLEGEGYFEVAKDKAHPFLVQTKEQVVEVLGTHFNINAYQDEPNVKTTLVEGSVRVTAASAAPSSSAASSPAPSSSSAPSSSRANARDLLNKRSLAALEMTAKSRDNGAAAITKILKPNEQALNNGTTLRVVAVDAAATIDWKNNEFLFDGEALDVIMRRVARWYDVKVIYKGEMPKVKFVGGVSRFDHVSKLLKMLESTSNVRFRIEGRTIYVL